MKKQDKQGVRTAADVERKYNLGKINSSQGLGTKGELILNQIKQTLAQYMANTNVKIEELTDKVDRSLLSAELDETLNRYADGKIGINLSNEVKKGNSLPVTSDAVALAFDELDFVIPEDYPTIKEIGEAITSAISDAKESGEFKGDAFTYEDFTPEQLSALLGSRGVQYEDSDYPGCFYYLVDNLKEWVNPPMVAGVEYRTADRFNGNIVYTKLVDFGFLPDTSAKGVSIGVAAEKVVSVNAFACNTSYMTALPYIDSSGKTVCRFHINANKSFIVNTFDDRSSYTATVIIKYIK